MNSLPRGNKLFINESIKVKKHAIIIVLMCDSTCRAFFMGLEEHQAVLVVISQKTKTNTTPTGYDAGLETQQTVNVYYQEIKPATTPNVTFRLLKYM